MRTMVNNLQSGFHQGWYILVFRVPAQCENCLKIMVHSNDHPTLTGTNWMNVSYLVHCVTSCISLICKLFSFSNCQPFEDGLDHLLYAPHCSFQSRCNQIQLSLHTCPSSKIQHSFGIYNVFLFEFYNRSKMVIIQKTT